MSITYKSLIDRNEEATFEVVQRQADLIITSVILGFSGTRYYLNQPCSFEVELEPLPVDLQKDQTRDENGLTAMDRWEIENALEQQNFITTVACLADVLERYQGGMGEWLVDRQSQKGGKGELITGREGGATIESANRDKVPKSWKTRQLIKNLTDDPENKWAIENKIYIGRGAYTGIYDDDVELFGDISYKDGTSTRPTLRVFRKDEAWLPERSANDLYHEVPWGVIAVPIDEDKYPDEAKVPNYDSIAKGGMGPLPGNNNKSKKIGYIHGLCSAVHVCAFHGPWTTPYEVATGNLTTKIASCFPCTTFLYAAGYPPSSAHLGRGESWVPPIKDDQVAVEKDSYPISIEPEKSLIAKGNPYIEEDCDSFKTHWDDDIADYLRLGVEIIIKGEQREAERLKKVLVDGLQNNLEALVVMSPEYKETLGALRAFVAVKHTNDELSSRFLDALTVHDSEWKRVKRTFEPLYNRKRTKELLLSGNVQLKQ
ncbi:hypothetical protein [Gynuella sunshinyii]|uniref:Uncharacterized protein n=1 Tax=Gynuella sunshinyii YC6258 TaxID=1445510 RepID=A0A0C5VCX7_9GAMM|nr:hypothetical protein [Gynuella sunshinyii]AJQ92111.1 hypothetical Protein YC6258_00055 [Gynuella sunshinyii YC6258]